MAKGFASTGDLAEKKVTFSEIGTDLYAFTAEGDPNSAIVVGDDGCLVFDAQATPAMANKVIERVRAVTDKPIKYVVLSHYHAVRVLGASAYHAQAIVASASACSLAIKEYRHALAGDLKYAAKAARISALARDLSELLPELVPALKNRMRLGEFERLAFHPPCTLQHGQRLRGGIEGHLRALGFEVNVAGAESHLCCGSAGTYSILQPDLARQLRDRKLENLAELGAQYIVSANMGCIQHLQSGTHTPVRHWVEVLDEALV